MLCHLLYDVLSGAVARGLDDSMRLLWGHVVDLDEEHVLLPSASSPSLSASRHHLLVPLRRRAPLAHILQQQHSSRYNGKVMCVGLSQLLHNRLIVII